MSYLKNSKIHFNKSNGIYKPGDILNFSAEINLNSSKIVRGIIIEIKGYANVEFTGRKKTYVNNEIYFKKKLYNLGTGNIDEVLKLSPGKHIFSFEYQLSSNLPPSFKSKYGKIIYSIKVTLDRPCKINKYIKTQFIVESIPDHPQVKRPGFLIMKNKYNICDTSEPLEAVVRIPHSGFTFGQMIPVTFEVKNNTNTVVLSNISVKLQEVQTYHSTEIDKKEEKTLSKIKTQCQISPHTSNSFDHSLQVPNNVILQDLSNCKIIDFDYQIRVEVYTSESILFLYGKMSLYPTRTSSPVTILPDDHLPVYGYRPYWKS